MSSASRHNEHLFSPNCLLLVSVFPAFVRTSASLLLIVTIKAKNLLKKTSWMAQVMGRRSVNTEVSSVRSRARAAFSLLNTRRWEACQLLNSAAKVELFFLSLVKSSARFLNSYLLLLLYGLFRVCFSFALPSKSLKCSVAPSLSLWRELIMLHWHALPGISLRGKPRLTVASLIKWLLTSLPKTEDSFISCLHLYSIFFTFCFPFVSHFNY